MGSVLDFESHGAIVWFQNTWNVQQEPFGVIICSFAISVGPQQTAVVLKKAAVKLCRQSHCCVRRAHRLHRLFL